MPKLTALTSREATKTVTVEIDAITLTVSYRANILTPAYQKALAQGSDGDDLDVSILTPLTEILASWDIEADDGTPLPITVETLSPVPMRVLLAIMAAIRSDLAPNPQSAERSSNGSSRTESSATARTGTAS